MDQNCAPTWPCLRRSRSVCPVVRVRRSYAATSIGAVSDCRISHARSLWPSISGTERRIFLARSSAGSFWAAASAAVVTRRASSRRPERWTGCMGGLVGVVDKAAGSSGPMDAHQLGPQDELGADCAVVLVGTAGLRVGPGEPATYGRIVGLRVDGT